VKRNAANDGPKGAVPVGEVAGILPEEVTDERFSQPLIACVLHKEMLDFGGHPTLIEDPVGHFHPLQIDGDHREAIAEEDIGGGGVSMNKDLVVFPHKLLTTPLFLEPIEVFGLIPSDIPPVLQLIHNLVEVGTVPAHVHPQAGRGPIVHGGKKIGKGGEFEKEGFPRSFLDCINDKVVERYTIAEFLDQDTVETGIAAEGTDNVMRVTGKADVA